MKVSLKRKYLSEQEPYDLRKNRKKRKIAIRDVNDSDGCDSDGCDSDGCDSDDYISDGCDSDDYISDNNGKINTKTNTKTNTTGEFFSINTDQNDDISNWNLWVPATQTRNYLLDDGILDVLKYQASTLTKINTNYQDKFIKTIGDNKNNNFVKEIMNQGNKFEIKVIKMLSNKLGVNNIKNIGGDYNPRSKNKYLETIEALKSGVPVIYQGVLRNYKNNTYGIPDLLIRSDWLSKIFTKIPISKSDSKIKAPLLFSSKARKKSKYHYLVVDIKFKTLFLNSDGIHLRNDGIMKAYKSQLCVYNEALGILQGYEPPAAFILGWKWKYVNKKNLYQGNDCFDRLGRIDYSKVDKEYKTKTHKAVEWILNVRQNCSEWDLSVLPLPHEQLYPNMCNRYDFPYHKLKKRFAEDINEISLVWNCGPKQRKFAHANNVFSWTNPECTPENMNVNGEFKSKVMSRILEANRSTGKSKIFPKYITNNFKDWKNAGLLELFVDFEMTCGVLSEFDNMSYDDMSSNGSPNLIFMIGVGYINNKNEWVFKDFTVNRVTPEEEYRICADFVNYVQTLKIQYNCDIPALYHWSHAEPVSWKKAVKSNYPFTEKWPDFNWSDLLRVFQIEPIGIKGCLNYGLKNVAKTFHKHGYIQTIWDSNGACVDGAEAALGAYKINKETKKRRVPFNTDPLVLEIIKYNEVDCKVLQEILYYIRRYHINPNDEDIDINLSDDGCDDSEIYLYESSEEETPSMCRYVSLNETHESTPAKTNNMDITNMEIDGGEMDDSEMDDDLYYPSETSDDHEWFEYNSDSE